VTGLYLDASAITKLVITEAETEALQRRVLGRDLISSRVAVVEVTKAVARANPTADPQGILSRLAFVELDAELARIAGSIGGSALRALDAIHIASALRLESEADAFVTYDDRQASAARTAGLSVEAPGQP
jgi:predicted nucleic acid-binding protein